MTMNAILLAAVLLGAVPGRAVPPADDAVFRAMKDEMSRNMRRLRMDDLPGPYHLAYAVRSGTQAFITAFMAFLTILEPVTSEATFSSSFTFQSI